MKHYWWFDAARDAYVEVALIEELGGDRYDVMLPGGQIVAVEEKDFLETEGE